MKCLIWKFVILSITMKWTYALRAMDAIVPTLNETLSEETLKQLEKKLIPKLDFNPKRKKTHDNGPDAGVMEDIQVRIAGGKLASRGQFPWQVGIKLENVALCGGSILSKYWILTAAHCLIDFKTFEVYVGMQNRSVPESGRMIFETNKKFIHPNYVKKFFNNDIALLNLLSGIPMKRRDAPLARSIRLPKVSAAKKSVTYDNVTALISGWGRTAKAGDLSNVLNYVTRTIMSNVECAKIYGPLFILDSTMCISTKGRNSTCQGDSGGPMVYKEKDGKWTQIGIVSFGAVKDCTAELPAAFTRTTSFLGWINQMTGLKMRK